MMPLHALGSLLALTWPSARVGGRKWPTVAGPPHISANEFHEVAARLLALTRGVDTLDRRVLELHGLLTSADAEGWGAVDRKLLDVPDGFCGPDQDALVRLGQVQRARGFLPQDSWLLVPWRSRRGTITTLQMMDPTVPTKVQFVLGRVPSEPYGADRLTKAKGFGSRSSVTLVDGPLHVLALRLRHRHEHRDGVVLALPRGLKLGTWMKACDGRDVHLALRHGRRSADLEPALYAAGARTVFTHRCTTGGWTSDLHWAWNLCPPQHGSAP